MATAAQKTVTIKLKEQITLKEVPEARAILVGLRANGSDQRVVTIREPGMTAFIELQAAARELDKDLPMLPIPEDPQNPTGEEIQARADAAREQQAYVYGETQPYGKLFRQILEVCCDDKVEDDELPVWALGVEGVRRVLDFYKGLSLGPAADALLAAIRQQEPSS